MCDVHVIFQSLCSVGHTNKLTNFCRKPELSIFSGFLYIGGEKISSFFFLIQIFFLNLPLFCLITLKPLILRKQKNIAILLWILKRMKKKKAKILKKSAFGHSRQFWSQIKAVLPVTFLFIKRFQKTLCQNVRLDES